VLGNREETLRDSTQFGCVVGFLLGLVVAFAVKVLVS
jgi:hypothetical protein